MKLRKSLKNGVAIATTVYPSFGLQPPDYPLLMELSGGKVLQLNKEVPGHDPVEPRSTVARVRR